MRRMRGSPADHGEHITYLRGCRCDDCKASNARYNRQLRAKKGKEHVRNANLKSTHGISLEEYNKRFNDQNGVCASCGNPEVGHNQYGPVPLAVDHNHETGEVRGLLCMRCNRALGLLHDDVQRVENLAAYRRRYA